MLFPDQHIILLGFKHVGKSVIGRQLAAQLAQPFIDLDKATEKLYTKLYTKQLSCREISLQHGEAFFRDLESKALSEVIHLKPTIIIALGGGAPLSEQNQQLLKPHILIYLTAEPEVVFQRIMAKGIPSFFTADDPLGSFKRLWEQRAPVYQSLATFIVENRGKVRDTVQNILEKLRTCKGHNHRT